MPGKSIYYTDKGDFFTPESFVEEYNKYEFLDDASKAMGISKSRLSVIASRLRSRNYPVKIFPFVGKRINNKDSLI